MLRLRLFLLRWREESLLASAGHHQALRDLHEEAYLKASEDLRRVRSEIAVRTPARQMLDEALVRPRGRA